MIFKSFSSLQRRAVTVVVAFLFMGMGFVFSGCMILEGSGKIIQISEQVDSFDQIRLSSGFQLKLKRGEKSDLSLSIDHNLRSFLEVSVKKGTLYLGLSPHVIYTKYTATAEITLPTLQSLHISGASIVTVEGLQCNGSLSLRASGASQLTWTGALSISELSLDASGASRIDLEDLTVSGLTTIKLSGASQTNIKGVGTKIELQASGASQAKIVEFAADEAEINLSGASLGELQIVKRIWGSLSGASNLSYLGNPDLKDIKTSGASQIVSYLSKKPQSTP